MKRKCLSMCMKRGQHLEISDGVSLYVKKGGSNNYRLVLLLPENLIASRTKKFGPSECSQEEFRRYSDELKERYERRKAEGKALETTIELEDSDEVYDDDAALHKSGAF